VKKVAGEALGEMDALEESTIICRCEDVTLKEIRDLIRQGYTSIDEIKRLLRAGMGPCQGRTCRNLIAQEIAKHTGIPISEVTPGRFRPPTRPVKLGVIAAGAEGGEADD